MSEYEVTVGAERRPKIFCKKCGVSSYVKNGVFRGKQRYKCKDCGCQFTDHHPAVNHLS